MIAGRDTAATSSQARRQRCAASTEISVRRPHFIMRDARPCSGPHQAVEQAPRQSVGDAESEDAEGCKLVDGRQEAARASAPFDFSGHDRSPCAASALERTRHCDVKGSGSPRRFDVAAAEAAALPAALRFGLGPNVPGAHAPGAILSLWSRQKNSVPSATVQSLTIDLVGGRRWLCVSARYPCMLPRGGIRGSKQCRRDKRSALDCHRHRRIGRRMHQTKPVYLERLCNRLRRELHKFARAEDMRESALPRKPTSHCIAAK